MESEACPFSVLPVDVCHSILTQAFQQLDQRHLLTITPLVCHLWHQLSFSACTSLEVEVETSEAAQQFAAWVLKHRHRLLRLSVHDSEPYRAAVVKPLLEAIPAASQLRDLHLTSDNVFQECGFLQSLSSLTCLSMHAVGIPPDTISSLLALTQLRSLALTKMFDLVDFTLIARSLVQLTSVEFSSNYMELRNSIGQLSALRSLTGLQQLRLGDVCVPSQRLGELDGLPVTEIGVSINTAEEISIASSWLQPRLADKMESIWLTDSWGPQVIGESDLVKLLPALSAAGPQFKVLGLYFTHFNPLVSQLTGLTQLTSLALKDGTLDQGALQQLSILSGLQILSLEDSDIDAAWAEGAVLGLAAALPHLTRLVLCDEEAVTPSILQALGSRVKSRSKSVLVLKQQE